MILDLYTFCPESQYNIRLTINNRSVIQMMFFNKKLIITLIISNPNFNSNTPIINITTIPIIPNTLIIYNLLKYSTKMIEQNATHKFTNYQIISS